MEARTQTLVILDFGSQYTQLIARKARELGVFCLILPYKTSPAKLISLKPLGIILSGGPNSVYDTGAPKINSKIFELGMPILGICYGLQLIAQAFGGQVVPASSREYGASQMTKVAPSLLLKGINNSTVWMSHGDHLTKLPYGFKLSAKSGDTICAIEDSKRQLYGLQFHPEVSHTHHGQQILKNFLDLCGFRQDWLAAKIIPEQIMAIQKKVGLHNIICALSGGVDSSVAATLVNRAVGPQQLCVFVDTGLLRQGEYAEVLRIYKDIGLNVRPIRAKQRFLGQLKGVTSPEAKRKIIGREFIRIFEQQAKLTTARFLVQGTLYPDVIESVSVNGPSVTIKSHHNVGGLPDRMKLEVLEPLRELFKDEVRQIGRELGLPASLVQRQPFPGPGLAVRIIGEVTPRRLTILSKADAIVRQEVVKGRQQSKLWQFFAVLLPIRSVGVMGDGRTYEQVVAIRAVQSTDGMTAHWAKLPPALLERMSSRIISEVRGVNRVVYDITSKPPGTIEWE